MMKCFGSNAAALLAIGVTAAALPGVASAQTAPLGTRTLDALRIENVMGALSNHILNGQFDRAEALFAMNMPDVRMNYPYPMQGPAALEAFWRSRIAVGLKDGELHWFPLLSPVIEVAGDGKTAKATWDVNGYGTFGLDHGAKWDFRRYAVDLVKQDGAWKIWHFAQYQLLTSPFEKSFVQVAAEERAAGGNRKAPRPAPGPAPGDEIAPGGPFAPPDNPRLAPRGPGAERIARYYDTRYTGGTPARPLPLPPEPYLTFDPKTAY